MRWMCGQAGYPIGRARFGGVRASTFLQAMIVLFGAIVDIDKGDGAAAAERNHIWLDENQRCNVALLHPSKTKTDSHL